MRKPRPLEPLASDEHGGDTAAMLERFIQALLDCCPDVRIC
jgi:hypothetical protein